MKLKPKIDKAQLQKFFETHGEKITFAVVTLFAIVLCYKALKIPSFPITPKEMSDSAKSFANQVAINPVPDTKIKDLTPFVTVAARTVVAGPAVTAGPLNPPIVDQVARRTEPPFLPPIEVIATSTSGALAHRYEAPKVEEEEGQTRPRRTRKDLNATEERVVSGTERAGASGMKDARPVGKQWIVVTAAVPIRDQLSEYRKHLSSSDYALKDQVPAYVGYRLQRAVVAPDGTVTEAAWQDVDVKEFDINRLQWKDTAKVNDVDKVFLNPVLTKELPLLFGEQHDPDLVGHPRLTAEEEAEVAPAAGAPPENAAAPNARAPRPAKEAAPYLLFRYLDFAVQPDSTYRYRVAVTLENPNLNVPIQFLESPEFASGPTRNSPFSEASSDVKVPALIDLFAGGISKPGGDFSKMAIAMLIRKFDPEKATKVTKELKRPEAVRRGKLADFALSDVTYLDPQTGEMKQEKINLTTNFLVLDMAGGGKIDVPDGQGAMKTAPIPSEVLVVDGAGRITVKQSLTDARAIELERKRATRAKEAPARAAAVDSKDDGLIKPGRAGR